MNALEFIYALRDRFSGPARRMASALKVFNDRQDATEKRLKDFVRAGATIRAPFDSASGAVSRFKGVLMGLAGAGAIAVGALGVAGFAGAQVVNAAAFKEQQLIGLTTLLKDAGAAAYVYAKASEFAARTPFETPEVLMATKQLLAYKFTLAEVPRLLTAAGDASSALGLGSEGLQQINRALGQIKAKGKLSAEELNQLQEAGIGAAGYVAKALNTDTATALKLVEKRAVGAEFAIGAIVRGMERDFGGGMAKQARTISGLFSTLASRPFELFSSLMPDSLKGGPLEPLRAFMDNLAQLTDFTKEPGKGIQATFQASIGGLFGAVFGTAAKATQGQGGVQLVRGILERINSVTAFIKREGPGALATARTVFTGIGQVIGFMANVLRFLAPYLPVLLGLFVAFKLISGAIAVVQTLSMVATALRVVGVAAWAAMGPWSLLVGALVIGVGLVIANWGKIGPFLAGVWETVKTVFFSAVNFVTSLVGQFVSLGSQLIQGLINGITSRANAVKDAVVGAAQGAIGWFKGVLGIKSPSRVFAALGAQLPAGLEVGIRRGQGRVTRAIGALGAGATITASAMAPVQAGAGVGGARTASITLNFNNTQMPGSSGARETAETMMETLFDALEQAGFEVNGERE